jgi:hypothetical protein
VTCLQDIRSRARGSVKRFKQLQTCLWRERKLASSNCCSPDHPSLPLEQRVPYAVATEALRENCVQVQALRRKRSGDRWIHRSRLAGLHPELAYRLFCQASKTNQIACEPAIQCHQRSCPGMAGNQAAILYSADVKACRRFTWRGLAARSPLYVITKQSRTSACLLLRKTLILISFYGSFLDQKEEITVLYRVQCFRKVRCFDLAAAGRQKTATKTNFSTYGTDMVERAHLPTEFVQLHPRSKVAGERAVYQAKSVVQRCGKTRDALFKLVPATNLPKTCQVCGKLN